MPYPQRLSARTRLALISAPVAALAPRIGLAQGAPVNTPSRSQATPITEDVDFAGVAASMWQSIQAAFRLPDPEDHGLYREFHPHIPSGRRYAYLWPFSTVLSGVNALARLNETEAIGRDLREVLGTLDAYFDPESDPPGYDSYPVGAGGGDKFYDDNEWVGIDSVYAWRTLGDRALLVQAERIWEFAISGWTDEDMGGGIYWQQGNLESKNTCSNGPAAVLALLLHQETGDEAYLDWAIRIVDWLDVLYDDATGVYNDNIRADGSIEPTKWTYNAGTPLHAFALLYDATGDETWLDRARTLAADSLRHFAPDRTDDGAPIFPDTPWFNSILHRGYVTLYEVDPDRDPTYIAALPALLRHAWRQARDDDGFLPPDWSLNAPTTDYRHLLDQAPVMEIAASYAQLTR